VLLWLVILSSIAIEVPIIMEDNITNHMNTNHSYRTSIVMEDDITNHSNTNHSFRTSIVMEDNINHHNNTTHSYRTSVMEDNINQGVVCVVVVGYIVLHYY
jgi:hypothetical protein